MVNISYSSHAIKRARQRGVKKEIITLIYKEGDKKVKKMGKAFALYISEKKINRLQKLNYYKKDTLDKSKNIYLIISEEETLITVVREKKSRYRRNIKYSLVA